MLCTLRPVSNLLSLALRLTEHLHNLAVPKSKEAQAHPPPPTSPLLTCHSANTHAPNQPTNPSPKSTMQEGTYSATVCFFYLTLKVSFPFFFFFLNLLVYLSISSLNLLPVPCKMCLSHTQTDTHIHTRACTHNSLLWVCLVNFVHFVLGLFFKDSISQSLWLAGFRQLHLGYVCPRQVEQKC